MYDDICVFMLLIAVINSAHKFCVCQLQFAWSMVLEVTKAGWKFRSVESGALCAMTAGIQRMLELYVDSLDMAGTFSVCLNVSPSCTHGVDFPVASLLLLISFV